MYIYITDKVGNWAILYNAKAPCTMPKHFRQCKNDNFNT